MTRPLLILSDNPAGTTGLGRITRELALRIHEDLSDVFRVGTAGIGGNHSSKLPFPNYPVTQLQQLVPLDLPSIWRDFAGDEKGVLLCIENLAWVTWLAQPERLPANLPLRAFLGGGAKRPENIPEDAWSQLSPTMQKIVGVSTAPFEKWLYCPVDGDLPNGTLGVEASPILAGFDRVLAYTPFGSRVIEKTLALDGIHKTIPSIPHGIDTSVFYPRDKREARRTMVMRLSGGQKDVPIGDDTVLIGAVATNSYRKDWGLCFETCAELVRRGVNVFLWAHTNDLNGVLPNSYWSVMSLAQNFGLKDRVILTSESITSDNMAWCLSACDVGLHIGSGEGYGYFGPDSLACGVPVVHGNYASGAEILPSHMLVEPAGYRLESKWMMRRPCYQPSAWADKVMELLAKTKQDGPPTLPSELDWRNLWPTWKAWLNGMEPAKVLQMASPDGNLVEDCAVGSGD